MADLTSGQYVSRVTSNAKARVNSVMQTIPDFKSGGIIHVITGLGDRFAANNRALFPILRGGA